MTWTVRRAFVAGTVMICAFAILPRDGHADGGLVSLKALLAVQDPASRLTNAKPALAPRQLSQTDADSEKQEQEQEQVDDETPTALSGTPEPTETDELLTKAPARPADDEEDSVFKTWWFWALTAAVVGGTVALGVWAAQPEDQPAGLCSPGVIACFGDGR